MKSQTHKNKGFSFIELLIAMTILSIVMIMVVQFMSTSSGALAKTKKNLNLQTEALEVSEKLSDVITQATYIRVVTQDDKIYELDNTLENERKKRTLTETTETGSLAGGYHLAVDNFPNYLGDTGTKKIILDNASYKLVKEDDVTQAYGFSGGIEAKSFRILTTSAGKQLYVKPKYIYLQYQRKVNGSESNAYAIYKFEKNTISMYRDTLPATYTEDGYGDAKAKVDANGSCLTESISIDDADLPDCYFSANAEGNTVMFDILFKDSRYKKYTYNYAETILLRNSNVLTVAPNKMYKKK